MTEEESWCRGVVVENCDKAGEGSVGVSGGWKMSSARLMAAVEHIRGRGASAVYSHFWGMWWRPK